MDCREKGLNIVEVQKATEDGHTRRPHWSCRSMHTHHHGVRRSHQVNKQAYDQSGVGCSFRDNEQTFTIRLRYMFNVIHSTQSRAHMTVHHHHLHHLHYHHLHLLLLVQCFILNLAFRQIISCKVWETFSFPNGLILRTFRPFNVFILLNGWICWHGVLDEVGFRTHLHFHFISPNILFRRRVFSGNRLHSCREYQTNSSQETISIHNLVS